MNIDRVYNRVMANYAQGVRGDITIADFQRLDGVSAHLLLEFEPHMGKPKGSDIERYLAKTFEGRILPVMASCRIKDHSVSIVAALSVPTRDMSEASKLTPVIAGLMYLDTELQEAWEVRDLDGKKVLAKTCKENVEQIIAARRNRMFVTRTPSVSLASVATVREFLGEGDTVQAWLNSEMQPVEIMASIKGGYKVKDAEGKERVIAKEAVLDIQKMAADKAPNETAKLIKYFEEAYGDKEYAKQLVKA